MWICFSETFIRKIKVSIVTKTENKQEYFVCSKNTFLVKKEWWQKYSLGESQTTRSAMIIICQMSTVQVRKMENFSTKDNLWNGSKFFIYISSFMILYTSWYSYTFWKVFGALPTLGWKGKQIDKTSMCLC